MVLVLSHRGIYPKTWIGRAPCDVSTGPNGVIKAAVCEDGSVQGVPRPAKRALPGGRKRQVRLLHLRVVDVYALVPHKHLSCQEWPTYVFILEGCVRSLPCRDATATIAQRDEARLDPSSSESIEEVGLPSNLIIVEVGIAEFANVYLSTC